MRPKRILFVEANEDGTVGGSHQALYDLMRFLDPQRYQPIALFYQDNIFVERLRALGQEVISWEAIRASEHAGYRAGGAWRTAYTLTHAIRRRYQFLRKRRVDLVHINNSPRIGNDDWLPAARAAGIPIVANAMGDADGTTGFIGRWLFTKFDRVIAVSQYIEGAMVALGVPPANVVTVNHGVDVAGIRGRVTQSVDEVRTKLEVPAGNVLVMMVGNVREWKGQHVLLEALRRVRPDIRGHIRVVFVGDVRPEDQNYRVRLEDMVRHGGLETTVQFLGQRRDIPNLLNAAEIAVHASTMPEPGGIVVLEAMALGNAIIAADTGGHVEYLVPEYGLLHNVQVPDELASAITELVVNDDKRRMYGKRASTRVEEFSIQRNVAGFEAVYQSIFRDHPSG